MSHGKDGENVKRGTHRINLCALRGTNDDKGGLKPVLIMNFSIP